MSISVCSCFGERHASCSLKKCCFLLSIFILFIIIASMAAALIVIFIVKPQKPVFSLQSMGLNSYTLKAYSDSTLLVSSAVTLILQAQNPNIFGLRYRPSRLHLYFQGLRIGLVRVPGFYQAAHSNNVSVAAKILVDSVNVTQIVSGGLLQDNLIHMELLGDVGLQLRLFRLTMPKIKIAIDCDINFDYTEFIFNAEVFDLLTVQHPTEYFDPKNKSFSINCAPALNI